MALVSLYSYQTAIAPHPHKPERLFPHIKVAPQTLNSCKDAVIIKLVMCKSWL
jgi:hypothetical protein